MGGVSRSRHHPKYGIPFGTGTKQRACGYEFWTARPGNIGGASGFGPVAKHFTHRRERRQGERETRRELDAA